MKTLLNFLLLTLISTGHIFAQFGSEGIGGAVAIVCKDKEQKSHVYLADTFDVMKTGKFKKFESIDPEIIFEAALSILKSKNVGIDNESLEFTKDNLAYRYINPQATYNYLNIKTYRPELCQSSQSKRYCSDGQYSLPMATKGDQPLIETNDDHISALSLPINCEKKQLAVQSLKDKTYIIDLVLQAELTNLEKGLLKAHEVFVSKRNIPRADTTSIRKIVNSVLEEPIVFEKAVERAIAQKPSTLKAFPAYLNCQISSVPHNDLNKKIPAQLELYNISSSQFEIKLSYTNSIPEVYKSYFTDINLNPSTTHLTSSMSVRLSFGNADEENGPGVFLYRYNETNKMLSGSIIFQEQNNLKQFTSFGISCLN